MKKNKWMILGLGTALMLTMAACSQQEAEETASPTPDPTNTPVQEEIVESPAAEPEEGAEATLTMTASFADEAGALLADTSVRFTVGDVEAEYVTAEDGTLTVASLPREGTLEVAVLDMDGQETASAVLEISEGSVTDVTAQEDGTIAVTLLSDTDQLSLSFVQENDGTLSCTLELSEES